MQQKIKISIQPNELFCRTEVVGVIKSSECAEKPVQDSATPEKQKK